MLFNSLEFIIFMPTVLALYWSMVAKRVTIRNYFLLLASYVFYGWWDWRFLLLIVLSTVVDYFVAIQIESNSEKGKRRFFLTVSILSNLGILGAFKYFDFFSQSLAEAFQSLGIHIDLLTLNVILPVGISFYTFQTLSYTIDVYKDKMPATRDAVSFFAFVSFFPQLVAGPIERAKNLLPQFYSHKKFNYAQSAEGLRLILWGFFKKIVIADNCAIVVDYVFGNYDATSGLKLIAGAIFFAFQIYGDFSGYSDIATGCAKLFGFELMTNFKTPYFSRDIAEFWRRWHIILVVMVSRLFVYSSRGEFTWQESRYQKYDYSFSC